MRQSIAATLAATVILAGIVLPAQSALAEEGSSAVNQPTTPAPTSSQSSTPAPSATASPTTPATDPNPIVSPIATPPAAKPTSTPKPTATPIPRSVPERLQTTVATGDLMGVQLKAPKREKFLLHGTVSTDGAAQGRYFKLESYSPTTKRWTSFTAGRTTSAGAWEAYIAPTTDDTQTVRLVISAIDTGFEPYTSPSTTVVRTKGTIDVNTNQNPATIKSVPWEQQQFKAWTSFYTSGVPLQLQKLDGKTWKAVSSLTTNNSTYQYSFNLPKGDAKSKNTTVKYRVVLSSSMNFEAATSSTIDVIWENPNLYTGTQKTAYSYSAKYCPTVMISLDSKLNQTGAWGKAQIGSNRPKVMVLYTKIPSNNLKTVALHECSHFYQWNTANNKDNKGWDAYKAAANKLMGTKDDLGMERVNECMSATWGGHNYWTYGASAKLCGQAKVKDFVQKSLKGQKVT